MMSDACGGKVQCCQSALGSIPDADYTRVPVLGEIATPAGVVPQVGTTLAWADEVGALKVRLNMRRMHYAVAPGLYAVGTPTPESPVLVSANYKLSFDRLRQELGGLDAWILVLDTKGINVWCAAGKGTFGTDEIVRQVDETGLTQVVAHRVLIVPQLGAPGVAAHEVTARTGFRVVYGPVYAKDLPAFLRAGMQATPEMRRVRFDLPARLVVIPVEVVLWARLALPLMAALFLLAGLNHHGYAAGSMLAHGPRAVLLLALATVGGGVLTPVLLPWLPGRAFATKGAVIGLLLALGVLVARWVPFATVGGKLEAAAWLLMIPAAAAFLAMNFTGASTYTSLSGVRKELRLALPVQIVAGAAGLLLWIVARVIS